MPFELLKRTRSCNKIKNKIVTLVDNERRYSALKPGFYALGISKV
jgi:hypothetical protein